MFKDVNIIIFNIHKRLIFFFFKFSLSTFLNKEEEHYSLSYILSYASGSPHI
jgi:hypothetical protein